MFLLSGGSGVSPTLIDELYCVSIVNENSLIQGEFNLIQAGPWRHFAHTAHCASVIRLSLWPLIVLQEIPAFLKTSIML